MKMQKNTTVLVLLLTVIFLFFMSCKKSSDTVSSDTAPTVVSTSPVNSDTGIVVSTIIMATFSTAMDPSTISGTTFTLKDNNLNAIGGVVIYGNKVATFTPSANLTKGTVYTTTITTGAKDTAGTALASNYSWSFKTASGGGSTTLGGYTGNFLAWTGSDDPDHYFQLVRINGQTGAVTNIGGNGFFRDLEYGPDGTLYGIGSTLVKINTADGSTTLVGSIHHGSQTGILMGGGSIAPNGKCYVRMNLADSIFTLDLTNGALTPVGLPTALIQDIEFASNGTFYASFADLFTLSPTDASTLSTIGEMSEYISSMTFGSSGTLYGIDNYPSTHIYTINLTTASLDSITRLGTIGLSSIVAERTVTLAKDVRLPKSQATPHYTNAQLRAEETQAKLDHARRMSLIR
jgi:hypothetical protein